MKIWYVFFDTFDGQSNVLRLIKVFTVPDLLIHAFSYNITISINITMTLLTNRGYCSGSTICRICTLARHLSLGSSMVRAPHRSSKGCGFNPRLGLRSRSSEVRACRTFICHLTLLLLLSLTLILANFIIYFSCISGMRRKIKSIPRRSRTCDEIHHASVPCT